jgi:hypothetical protein
MCVCLLVERFCGVAVLVLGGRPSQSADAPVAATAASGRVGVRPSVTAGLAAAPAYIADVSRSSRICTNELLAIGSVVVFLGAIAALVLVRARDLHQPAPVAARGPELVLQPAGS